MSRRQIYLQYAGLCLSNTETNELASADAQEGERAVLKWPTVAPAAVVMRYDISAHIQMGCGDMRNCMDGSVH